MEEYYGSAVDGRAWYRMSFNAQMPPRTARLRADFHDLQCTDCTRPLFVRWAADPRRCPDCLRRRPGETHPRLPADQCDCFCQCSHDDDDDSTDGEYLPEPDMNPNSPFDIVDSIPSQTHNPTSLNSGIVLARSTNTGPVPQSRLYRAETEAHHNSALTSQHDQDDVGDYFARHNQQAMTDELTALRAPISTWEHQDLRLLGYSDAYIRQQFRELHDFGTRQVRQFDFTTPLHCTVCNLPRSEALRALLDNEQVHMCELCHRPRRIALPAGTVLTLEQLQRCGCRCTCIEQGLILTSPSTSSSGSDSVSQRSLDTADQTMTIAPPFTGGNMTPNIVVIDGPANISPNTHAYLAFQCNFDRWYPAPWVNRCLQLGGFCARARTYELANYIHHLGICDSRNPLPPYDRMVELLGRFARQTARFLTSQPGRANPLLLARSLVQDEDPMAAVFPNGIRRSHHTPSGLPILIEQRFLQLDPAAFNNVDEPDSPSVTSTEDQEDIQNFLAMLGGAGPATNDVNRAFTTLRLGPVRPWNLDGNADGDDHPNDVVMDWQAATLPDSDHDDDHRP